jgi:hypothetical protein
MEKDEIVYAKNITLEKALELANQLATVCKQRSSGIFVYLFIFVVLGVHCIVGSLS